MKKIFLTLCLLTSTLPLIAQIKCTLQGEVIGRPESKVLILTKYNEDFRVVKSTRIKIKDGKFLHNFEVPHFEIYELTFEDEMKKGGWRPVNFSVINGTVKFKLHAMKDSYKNRVTGGRENKAITKWNKRAQKSRKRYDIVSEMYDFTEEQTYSKKGLDIYANLSKTTDRALKMDIYAEIDKLQGTDEFYSDEYNILRKRSDSISKVIYKEDEEYNRKNPSLIKYSELISDLTNFEYMYKGEETPIDNVNRRYKFFSEAYPNHTYNERCKNLIITAEKIRVGGSYIDFSAPDLNGNIVKLSSEIKGKIAIIDLWASW